MTDENKNGEFELPPLPESKNEFVPPKLNRYSKSEPLFIIVGSTLLVILLVGLLVVLTFALVSKTTDSSEDKEGKENNGNYETSRELREGEIWLRDKNGSEYIGEIDMDYYANLGDDTSSSSSKSSYSYSENNNAYTQSNYRYDDYSSSNTTTNTQTNSKYVASSSTNKNEFKVGDIIKFGNNNCKILDIKDNTALIITEYIICNMQYNRALEETTWENCSLRQYLNNEFYNSFSESDRERIIEVTNLNLDNPQYGTTGGNPTVDKIFLLSIEEANKYDIVIPRYVNLNIAWWLRSPGDEKTGASGVYGAGSVNTEGYYVDGYGGVRPTMWLRMD